MNRQKEYNKKYWKKNKEKIALNRKIKRSKRTLEEIRYDSLKTIKWRKDNLEKVNEYLRKRYYSIRIECLNYYSNNMLECNCCKEKEIKFLSIDHINNDGAKHRKEMKQKNIYRWLKTNNYPEGFQVLCYNCNLSKGFYGECPHKL